MLEGFTGIEFGCEIEDVRALEAEKKELRDTLRSLINHVNHVTAPHRHHQEIPKRRLDELSNYQIEAEKIEVKYYDNRN